MIKVSSPQYWLNMYNIYKEKISSAPSPRWSNYNIKISLPIAQTISQRLPRNE